MIPGSVPPRDLCCTAFMVHAKIQMIVRTQTYSCFKRQNIAQWLDPCQFHTGNLIYQKNPCLVLTVGILRMPLEQLLPVEWWREFGGHLRMLMLNGDSWHIMTWGPPEDVKSFWITHYLSPLFLGWVCLCILAPYFVAIQTQTCYFLPRGLKENDLKWPYFLKSQLPLKKSCGRV